MSSTFTQESFAGVDTNVLDAASTSLDVGKATMAELVIVGKTGTHGTHVVTLQTSPNDIDWLDTSVTVTGAGRAIHNPCPCAFLRVKITTAEGAASTCDIHITAV